MDEAVDVVCGEKFVEGHGDGNEDGDADDEVNEAGDHSEEADAAFEVLEVSRLVSGMGLGIEGQGPAAPSRFCAGILAAIALGHWNPHSS